MKIGFDANLEKENARTPLPSPSSSWWTRSIAVPMVGIVAAAALTLVLAGSVVILSLQLNSETKTAPQAPPSAAFLATDTTTQGGWKTVYGSVGFAVAQDQHKFPAFAKIGLPDKNHTTYWVDEIEEPRALQKPNGRKRIAGAWFSWTPFTIDVNLTDDKTHRLAVYVVDWDSVTRVENIEILHGTSQRVLDNRQVSRFNEGQYLVWNVSGHTIIRLTPVAGANAVVNGLFLD